MSCKDNENKGCELKECCKNDNKGCECSNCCGSDCGYEESRVSWIVPVGIGLVVGFGAAVVVFKYRNEIAELGESYGSEFKKIGKKNAKKIEKIVKDGLNNVKK